MNKSNFIRYCPPLSYFDKAFCDNPGDALFYSLNEIEPKLYEHKTFPEEEFIQPPILDPRNKLPISQPVHDYTVSKSPEIFRSGHQSLLTKKEHYLCVDFLLSLQTKENVFPYHLSCYEGTSDRRSEEKIKFLEFLQQYNDANYEKIYSPNLVFVKLYQRFYKLEAERMMKKHKDGIFQIQTGFPMPRSCGNADTHASVTDVQLVSSNGPIRFISYADVDLSKIRTRIDTYFEWSLNEEIQDCKAPLDSAQFDISAEALVMLLCAGEYIDVPTEAIVISTEGEDGESFVQINELLPSRNTGIHTAELVINKSTEVFLDLAQKNVTDEIQATGYKGPYSLQTHEQFMIHQKKAQRGTNLVKWKLSLEDGGIKIPMLTRTKPGYKKSQTKEQIHLSIKLEYKTKFGVEIPTKASLIREWIGQKLCTVPKSSTRRHRINASTFETVLHETLSLEEIEQQLETLYNVKITRLLGSLVDFLGLFSKVPYGRYLLRYNSRFKDKLMLYGEIEGPTTSKTCITLHGLLKEEPSDMAFMTQRQLTPIHDQLCSAVHTFNHVLPCAFPPWRTAQLPGKIIDDRDFILKKVKEKDDFEAAKKLKQQERRKHVKHLKSAQKSKTKKQQRQEETDDIKELEQDINHDRLLYGYKSPEDL